MPRARTDQGFYGAIGERMWRTRIDRGIKQEKVAAGLSVSQQQLCKYERGTNAIPLVTLVEFAEIMRVSVGWLIQGEAGSETEDVAGPPPPPATRAHEQGIINAYRHIEDPNDRRVFRRMADIMAQGGKAP